MWQFDDLTTGATIVEPVGSKNGTVKGTYTFKEPGVYKVTLKVTDNTGVTSWVDTQDDVEAIVVVYDPACGIHHWRRLDLFATGSIGFRSHYDRQDEFWLQLQVLQGRDKPER